MLTAGHVTHYGGGLEVHQVSYPVDQKEHDFLPTDVHKPLTFIFSVFVWLETPFKTPNKQHKADIHVEGNVQSSFTFLQDECIRKFTNSQNFIFHEPLWESVVRFTE
jgi:hypothetical protein